MKSRAKSQSSSLRAEEKERRKIRAKGEMMDGSRERERQKGVVEDKKETGQHEWRPYCTVYSKSFVASEILTEGEGGVTHTNMHTRVIRWLSECNDGHFGLLSNPAVGNQWPRAICGPQGVRLWPAKTSQKCILWPACHDLSMSKV